MGDIWFTRVHVRTDIIASVGEIGFKMEVELGSHSTVREVSKLLVIIEPTDFDWFSKQRRDRQSRATDYHPGRPGTG